MGAETPHSPWYDDDAGPIVRLYAITGGRARPSGELFDLITLVTADSVADDNPTLTPEQARILELCRPVPQSVAELASHCDLPVSLMRVILGDLLEVGHIRITQPTTRSGIPDERLLRDVIAGLRAL
jgi:hypothetical protein